MKRPLSAAALAFAVTLSLTGCGSGTGSADPPAASPAAQTGDVNAADVTFTRSMIPHHQQAVQMARMATTRASSPDVKALALRIEHAQGPEIATMQGWLDTWGKHSPGASMGGMGHGSSMHMAGIMTRRDMTALRGARGAAFDQMFLTMMIAHHEGAITMAKTELSDGRFAQAKALATKIAAAQTTEIAEMKKLLRS